MNLRPKMPNNVRPMLSEGRCPTSPNHIEGLKQDLMTPHNVDGQTKPQSPLGLQERMKLPYNVKAGKYKSNKR